MARSSVSFAASSTALDSPDARSPGWRRRAAPGRRRAWAHRARPRRFLGEAAAAGGRVVLMRAFFLASRAQHVARATLLRAPVGDMLTAAATAGAVALWGLTLYLLGG